MDLYSAASTLNITDGAFINTVFSFAYLIEYDLVSLSDVTNALVKNTDRFYLFFNE